MSLLIALGLVWSLGQSPALPSAGVVSGQVVEDVTRAPIAGAHVTLHPMRPPSRSPRFGEQPRTASTDANGRYTFQNVEPGSYAIFARKTGFIQPGGMRMPQPVVVAGAAVPDVDLTLQRGAVITGRVLDEHGQPLPDLNVTAMRKRPPSRGVSGRDDVLLFAGGNAQTNDLGEFRLHSLQPGEIYLQALPRGGFGSSAESGATTMIPTYFPSTPEAAGAQPLHVAAGQAMGDVEIRMLRAPAFQVAGVVIDESGRRVANATVALSADGTSGGPGFMMGRAHRSRTDEAGTFTIDGVTAGAYTLTAVAPVVISRAPGRGSMGSGGASSFEMGSAGGGSIRSEVTTETRNGTTVEYRSDLGTRMAVAVGHGDVTGLEIVIRRPR